MASGAENYAAAQQAIAAALPGNSAMALRAAEVYAQLAAAAAYVGAALEGKPPSALSPDMTAWAGAITSTGPLPEIAVDDDGQIIPAL